MVDPGSMRYQATKSCRVLVVEDNQDAAELLGDWLRWRGWDVAVAHDGATALEIFRAGRTDAVVSDIELPGMSGYDLARAIRGIDVGGHTPLVAMTGYSRPEDHKRARDAGFTEQLTKPFDLTTLDGLLVRLLVGVGSSRLDSSAISSSVETQSAWTGT